MLFATVQRIARLGAKTQKLLAFYDSQVRQPIQRLLAERIRADEVMAKGPMAVRGRLNKKDESSGTNSSAGPSGPGAAKGGPAASAKTAKGSKSDVAKSGNSKSISNGIPSADARKNTLREASQSRAFLRDTVQTV